MTISKEAVEALLNKQGYSERTCSLFFEQLEVKAARQLVDALNNPRIVAAAAMPDMHYGNGIPIGSVLKTFKYSILI